MTMWYVVSTVLQMAHVLAAEVVPSVAMGAPIFGTGIPLVVGFLWAKKDAPEAMGATVGHGFVLGFVPAILGLIVAFLLGNVEAFLIVAGAASSGVTGMIGAAVGKKLGS